MQVLLRTTLKPGVFSQIHDFYCKYLAENGFTSADMLEGITQDQLPPDVFNEGLRLQIPRAFSPTVGQSLLFPDSDVIRLVPFVRKQSLGSQPIVQTGR